MTLVAVDSAVRDQADEVERVPPVRDTVHGGRQRRVREEVAVANALVDPGEVLIDDAAGAHVHVADFGVAHLPGGQANRFPRRDQLRMRVPCRQLVEDGRARHRDRVVLALRANTPTVEDDEDNRCLSVGRHASCLIAARPAYRVRVPSSSSILSNWLYFATRSERLAEPVLICPAAVPTARSAMVVSSVSPER